MGERKTVRKICVGKIIGARGVRGEVRIRSFTVEPGAIGAYGPVVADDGRQFEVKVLRVEKAGVVAKLAGVKDRNAAEALKSLSLYVDRDALPPPETGSYYHADLIGLKARLTTGEELGTVSAVFNFGAGDMLEVTATGGATELIPFSEAAIAAVDLVAGTVMVSPLPGMFDDDEEAG